MPSGSRCARLASGGIVTDWQQVLRTQSAELGVELTDPQLGAFERYLGLLLEWNRRINLTSITDPARVAVLHFLDSLTCLAASAFPARSRVADVGSGAGLPGIPIAIARPDLRVTLIESVSKKCRFLEAAISTAGLRNAAVSCARAEAAGHDAGLRESFDVVVTRAVADLAVAAELCLPLARLGGAAVMMKGPGARDEIARGAAAVKILGGELELARDFTLQAPDERVSRTIIWLRKRAPTPERYPRAPGRPAKRPLGIDTPRSQG